MARTVLPDGSVVMNPPGRSAIPTGSGATRARTPGQAAGGGPGARVGSAVPKRQPGRIPASTDAYK